MIEITIRLNLNWENYGLVAVDRCSGSHGTGNLGHLAVSERSEWSSSTRESRNSPMRRGQVGEEEDDADSASSYYSASKGFD